MFRRILTALGICLAVSAAFCGRREAAAAEESAAAPSTARTGGAAIIEDKALAEGRLLTVRHNPFDLGQSADLFDGRPETFARTEKANPAVLEFVFPEPRPISGVWIKLGGEDFRVTATVRHAGGGAPRTYTRELPHSGFDPEIEVDFEGDGAPVESVRLETSFASRRCAAGCR